jgi:superfamily I DNA/RNA helicase
MRTEIVECDKWPMVFAAGPGTGKTTLCKEHVAWLRDQGDRVLVVTFTRAAAAQLSVPGVEARTIDSFYYGWLKRFDKLGGFTGRNFELLGERFRECLRDKDMGTVIRNSYDCVVVDEAQDSNRKQLTDLWDVAQGNLHVFADIDQSIYEWRGAQPVTLLDFCDYHQVTPIPLDYTYRLTKQVMEASQRLILCNCKRFSVALKTDKVGPPVEFVETLYDVEATLSRLKEVNSNDVAVLLRNVARRDFMKLFWGQGLSKTPESHKPYAGTIHGAKGLEWENVFIVRADRFEFSRAPIEEERRLFYTAMTRSGRFLHISAFRPICFIKEAGLWGGSG